MKLTGRQAAKVYVARKKPRKITEKERLKGRSEDYNSQSAEDQWVEDKRLGILDWDGS